MVKILYVANSCEVDEIRGSRVRALARRPLARASHHMLKPENTSNRHPWYCATPISFSQTNKRLATQSVILKEDE